MWTTSDHILRFEKEEDQPLSFPDVFETDNLMDKWILSFTQSLVGFVIEEMAGECGYHGNQSNATFESYGVRVIFFSRAFYYKKQKSRKVANSRR